MCVNITHAHDHGADPKEKNAKVHLSLDVTNFQVKLVESPVTFEK